MHENVVSGLVRRRRELALEADTVRAQYEALLADVAALDRAILIFRPEADLADIPPLKFTRKAHWANRGEVTRAIIDTLRTAGEPLSTPELVGRVQEARSLPTDRLSLRTATTRARKALARLRDQGVISSRETDGQYLDWEIAR